MLFVLVFRAAAATFARRSRDGRCGAAALNGE